MIDIAKKAGVQLKSSTDIDRSHRVGKPQVGKARSIICKSSTHNTHLHRQGRAWLRLALTNYRQVSSIAVYVREVMNINNGTGMLCWSNVSSVGDEQKCTGQLQGSGVTVQ